MNPADHHSMLNLDYVQLERSFSSDDTEFLSLPNIPARADFANHFQLHPLSPQRQQQSQAPQLQPNEFYSRMSDFEPDSIDEAEPNVSPTSSPSASASSTPTTLSETYNAAASAYIDNNDNITNRNDAVQYNYNGNKQWSSSDEESSFYKDKTLAPCSEFGSPEMVHSTNHQTQYQQRCRRQLTPRFQCYGHGRGAYCYYIY